MYAKVIIDSKSRFLNRPFTYHIPEKLEYKVKKAIRVLVPFGRGNKTVVAFVYDIADDMKKDFDTKDIIDVVDDSKLISDELLNLAFYMTKNYLSPIQLSLKQVLPPTNIDQIKTFYKSNIESENEFLSFLNKERSIVEIKTKYPDQVDNLDGLINDNKIRLVYEAKESQKISYDNIVSMIDNENIFLAKNANKQKEIISYLKKYKTCEQKKLLKETGASLSSLNSLLDKNIIKISQIESNKNLIEKKNTYKKHDLNSEQRIAFNNIKENSPSNFLLFGVTGSGKTEIFLQLVEDVIKKGKEAIILVPEISLTPQTIERFSGRFDEKIAIIHSRLTPKEKFDQWRMVNNGEVKIVIGARSAIFAPFKNLGAIIIDEEHDNSYISSQDPKYNTKEIAKIRAKYHNCDLILASATPSVETMKEAIDGEFEILHLKDRINKVMPSIHLVDMREELKKSNYSMLSLKLQEEIKGNLLRKEQTILFLNKIGHDSFTFCRSCGFVIKCEACDVAMTYHKSLDRLVCHYCGRTKRQVHICPNCHSKKIKEFGAGTEKLEEEVRSFFPNANVLRMDSMVASNKRKYDQMYKDMKSGKIDILLGTQMIAKGLDFENVTLVGVVAADLSLNIGDFSAQENSFQLLTQVSGRAGRSNKVGRAIIQTYNPDNFVIQAVKNYNYNSFFENELKIRKTFSYPPFKNIITIRIINENRVETIDISKEFADILRKNLSQNFNVDIFGPNPCKISRINNKYRYNIMVKVFDSELEIVKNIVKNIRNAFINKYKESSFVVAINPVNIN
uniref:primosomal protein N' n=1 Tax=Anaerococcus mediterraneensis TaxID=1870984 RepID=UPI0009308D7C|nr:primosomal protein N' [Anaerococcus mediterraneensis]